MKIIKNIKIATTNSGIKYQNRDDLLLVSLPEGTSVAGVFTKSSMKAASISLCQNHLKNGKARGLVVNAGNANAFTGQKGVDSANRIAQKAADILECDVSDIFESSTGVIGEHLEDQLITDKFPEMVGRLSSDEDSWQKAAKAIITTDTFAKFTSKTVKINGKEIVINGIAKGSGMVAPNMATMLCYIFTNANIDSKNLQEILSEANEKTFNSITVDSDTSTNDTVLAFASGDGEELSSDGLEMFKDAFSQLMLDLAKMIVVDGEGATKLIEIEVVGADNKSAAKNIALCIANSPLVKTAIAGEDPNWGRIIMAIGKSGEKSNQETIDISIGDFEIVKNGELADKYNEYLVHQYLKSKEVRILVDINLGKYGWKVWTCDLTEGYIKINKDYRS
ncbi:MAG: glutamate N-acetyltransferase/amino-acid N-acetyltransferase [Rickettsiales bacterium]|jgi:glutamate N-acetyltransferase/amino-acid N-acetyltransferase